MPARFLGAAAAVGELVPEGATIGVAGMHMEAAPMALVREIARAGIRVRRLVTSPSSSLQADLLIGAGLVDEIVSPYVGFEHLGLAPGFRRAVESGELRVLEVDEGSLTHALYAGGAGIPFIPCPPGIELTDIPRVDPELFQKTTDPFTGAEGWAVPALRPDVTLLAAAEADEKGNIALGRFPFTDRLMALAAHRLVVQVERIVPAEDIAARAPGETFPAFLPAAVVVAPGGCRPTASPGFYPRDEDALRGYLRAGRDPESMAAWIEAYLAELPASEAART
ncbi:MAG: CoA transferase subunit A [Acidimicrobiia bacterium]